MRNRLLDVLNLLGNLGLILGLALVGVQIYQNTEIARMQMVHQDFLAIESSYWSMAGENPAEVWAKALSDPGSITKHEHIILDSILKARLAHLQKLVRLKELDLELVDPEQSQGIGTMAYVLSSDYGESWWAENQGQLPPALQEAISQALNRTPDNYLVSEIENLDAVIAERITRPSP